METTNEELKSTNEEMQSINEELQSANEELETSKEELQSLNEELATVNSELQIKVADLSRANNDMNNLLAGTGVGTLFVNPQLCIARFTPAATQVINLIETDIGRPVSHIVSNLVGYDQLVDDVKKVLKTLMPLEMEVQSKAGAWYLMRIRPYRTLENVIEGAVLTFVDITERKRMEDSLRVSERKFAKAFLATPDALLVMAEADGKVVDVNESWPEAFGINREDTIGRSLSQIGLFADQSWEKAVALVSVEGSARQVDVMLRTRDGQMRKAKMSIERLENGDKPRLLAIVYGISAEKPD
jgi:two-component system CheB/CheR fusion protein